MTYYLCPPCGQFSVKLLTHPVRKNNRKFALALSEVIHNTTSALGVIQTSLNSLAWVVLDDEIAFGFFLVGQG